MSGSQPPRPLRLLLAEDSLVQKTLVEFIVDEIPEAELVAAFEDGPDVLAYLHEQCAAEDGVLPDLVLLDINMPTMDGLEVLAKMRADPELQKLPVVMLTASGDEEIIAKAYEHGANTFLQKPMDVEKMNDVIRQFVNYWSQARLP